LKTKKLNNMRLVNISEDHYIIVDDSDIKEGDYFLNETSAIEVGIGNYHYKTLSPECKKITHSTKPIEVYYDDITGKEVWYYDKVQYFIPEVQGSNLNPFIQKMKL